MKKILYCVLLSCCFVCPVVATEEDDGDTCCWCFFKYGSFSKLLVIEKKRFLFIESQEAVKDTNKKS